MVYRRRFGGGEVCAVFTVDPQEISFAMTSVVRFALESCEPRALAGQKAQGPDQA